MKLDNLSIRIYLCSTYKQQPQYYKNARFGYVRCSEPVAYVRAIHGRYLAYLEQ